MNSRGSHRRARTMEYLGTILDYEQESIVAGCGESLRQGCTTLRLHLSHLKALTHIFSAATPDDAQDDMHTLQATFSLGYPLCHVWNVMAEQRSLPCIDMHDLGSNSDEFTRRLAASLFSTYFRQWEESTFTVSLSDILDPFNEENMCKLVNAVILIIKHLPSKAFNIPLFILKPLTLHPTVASAPQGWHRVIREFLKTERHYTQNLVHLQSYSTSLLDNNAIDAETLRHAFPHKLFTFQRKFLIQLENMAELPYHSQRWGHLFIKAKEDFKVIYQIYCVNVTLANSTLLVANEKLAEIQSSQHLPNPNAVFDKPLERLAHYPLFFEALRSASSADYAYTAELSLAGDALANVHKYLHCAQRKARTTKTIEELRRRMRDVHGFNMQLEHLGLLLQDSMLTVRIAHSEREHRVLLFEKAILYFQEVAESPSGKKRRESLSLISKSIYATDASKPRKMALQLQGCIPIETITDVLALASKDTSTNIYLEKIQIMYDGGKYIGLIYPSLQQKKLWENEIGRLRLRAPPAPDVPSPPLPPPPPPPLSPVTPQSNPATPAPHVKVKVHLGDEVFVTQVPRAIGYDSLRYILWNKARLMWSSYSAVDITSPRLPPAFKLKYKDEDDLLVSVVCTEDVGIAFGSRSNVVFFMSE